MFNSKENISPLSRSNYIRYLYNEGVRQGLHVNTDFYSEIIKFIKTPKGLDGFQKFKQINPKRFGINESSVGDTIKRIFS